MDHAERKLNWGWARFDEPLSPTLLVRPKICMRLKIWKIFRFPVAGQLKAPETDFRQFLALALSDFAEFRNIFSSCVE